MLTDHFIIINRRGEGVEKGKRGGAKWGAKGGAKGESIRNHREI